MSSLQMSRTGAWQEPLDPDVFERLRPKKTQYLISVLNSSSYAFCP